MFTVCPKCTLTLVVTTVDLRAGQGYVRCGRCANVFNALVALREGDPAAGISDTANRRLLETAPRPPVEPAHGAGVALDPEPEPTPEPAPEAESGPELIADAELLAEPEVIADPELIGDTALEPALYSDADSEPQSETIELSGDDHSMEFDPTATDVADIFVSPGAAEHDTSSGNYEAVVLGEEPAAAVLNEGEGEPYAELLPESEPLLVAASFDDPHAHTMSSGDWSLADDHADSHDDSLNLFTAGEPAPESGGAVPIESKADPAWVEEMFAEAEAQAESKRARAQDHDTTPDPTPAFAAAASAAAANAAAAKPAALNEDAAEHAEAVIALTTPQKRRPAWHYISGVAALGLLLLLQLVHHNRQSLVLSSAVGPAVSSVYGWFGVTLMPRWDLTAYSVKQLGAEAEGSEGTRLRVRLSLQNESSRVQPLPLLRLTLQDRYGNAVATRDLEPRDYLPKRVVEQRLLEPDQRIDAELHVIDPGKAAIGFEIDACLRAEGGSIGCANEARRRAAG